MGLRDKTAGVGQSLKRAKEVAADVTQLTPLWPDPTQARELQALAAELNAAAEAVDGRLVAGLLGGTGVGKSTLISALAGEPISPSSPIRPTTSEPVVYRHQSFPPLADWGGREIVHQAEKLKNLALVDLPDFDSLQTAHRQIVDRRLAELDLLIWLTDYHKYADRRFYEVFRQAQALISASAQVILLNKSDEILAWPQGRKALEEIMENIKQELSRQGGETLPEPQAVSATDALAQPQNRQAGGLEGLRNFLDDLAEEKYRRALEAGNLETRSQHLLETVKSQAQPQKWLDKLQALQKLRADFDPAPAIEADLALVKLGRAAYLEPFLTEAEQKSRGLMGFFVDGWAFASRRKQKGELTEAGHEPRAENLALRLVGAAEELAVIEGRKAAVDLSDISRHGGRIISQAIKSELKARRPSSLLLWLWPLALGLSLIWADTDGVYGGPMTVVAAALRMLTPWLMLSFLGDAVLSRLLWFRLRRALEADFQRGLDKSRRELSQEAQTNFSDPLDKLIAAKEKFLDKLSTLMSTRASS